MWSQSMVISNKQSGKTAKTEILFLCLRFNYFALNCLSFEFKSKHPVAVVEQQVIYQTNHIGKRCGINTNMSSSHALMLVPELTLQQRDTNAETAKLQQLAYWAYRYSSQVTIYNDCCLLLEVGKSIKLFNGLNHLTHLILQDLSSFGLSVETGLAFTPKAAFLMSLEPGKTHKLSNKPTLEILKKALNFLPLEHLEVDAKVKAKLLHCGFETVGDILDIPSKEIGVRFGQSFLDYWARLFGHKADPQKCVSPPEDFEASVDFAEPIQNIQWIDQQIQRLLKDLVHFTNSHHLICRGFTWRFFHENNRLLETITIGVSTKQNSLQSFYHLSSLKFETANLEWEFSSIELSSKLFVAKTLYANDLFDPHTDSEEFNELMDKFSNRLGRGALFRVGALEEQLPELINQQLDIDAGNLISHRNSAEARESVANYFSTNTLNTKTHSDAVTDFKDEPLWLLPKAKRLAQYDSKPLLNGPLNLVHGPDRISSHWWSKLQSRDYYIARQIDGRLVWLYFDRGSRQWFLHGLFA